MTWYRLVGAVLYALPVFRDTCMTIIATALPFFPLSVGVPGSVFSAVSFGFLTRYFSPPPPSFCLWDFFVKKKRGVGVVGGMALFLTLMDIMRLAW